MKMREVKLFGAVVVLISAGFFLDWSVQVPTFAPPAQTAKEGQQVVYLIIDEDTGQLRTFPNEHFFAGRTVFDILKTVSTRERLSFVYDPPGSYGAFIRQIGTRKNGEEKKYWQYWVNGRFAMVAADRYKLNSGDTILWKFASEQNQ